MTVHLELERVTRRHEDADRVFELEVERFTVEDNTRAAIIGPSGAGKSTLLDLLGLALGPSSARRFVLDAPYGPKDIAALWRERAVEALADIRRRRFGYVLQSGGLLPFLNVADNVALPMRLAGRKDRERLHRLLRRLDLERQQRARIADLSFGQRQRVAVARALAHGPDIVLADEPTAALDPATAREVMQLLWDLSHEEHRALVVVSHDHALLDAFPFERWHIDARAATDAHRARLVSEAGPALAAVAHG